MKVYSDITVAAGFNGGNPQWFRAAKALLVGTLPIKFVYYDANNLNPQYVQAWAAAGNGTGIPIVNDDEEKDFSFNLALFVTDPTECRRRIENHRRWLEAARAGAPDCEIASWYITPVPLGTDSTVGLAEFEALVAPLIEANDFAVRDIYGSTAITFEEWRQYFHQWIADCQRWDKEPVPTITPVMADTGAPCPWFDKQLKECAAQVERCVVWAGWAQDIPDLGDNLDILRRFMAETNGASLSQLTDDQLIEAFKAHAAEVNRRQLDYTDKKKNLDDAEKQVGTEMEK